MSSSLRKNIALLVLLQGSNYVAPLVTLPYLARVLGPTRFGTLAFAQGLIQYFLIVTEYGFHLTATRDIARNRNDRLYVSKTFFSVLATKALIAAAGFLVLSLIIPLFERLRTIRATLLVLYGVVVGSAMLPVWLFQGLEQMGVIALATTGARVVMIPVTFLLVTRPNDLVPAAATYAASYVLAGLISLAVVVRRRMVTWARPTWRQILELLRSSWHVFISSFAITICTATNTVVAGVVAGDAAAGTYSAGDKIVRALAALNYPIAQAVYPRVNAELAQSPQRGRYLMRKVAVVQGAVMFLVSLGLLVAARPLASLVFGEKYAGASQVIAILSILPFTLALACMFGVQMLLPLGMQRQYSRVIVLGAALNVALVVPLTFLWAQRGTAMAVTVTECCMGGAMAWVAITKLTPERSSHWLSQHQRPDLGLSDSGEL